MLSFYEQRSAAGMKRDSHHFEIESPFPESSTKRIKFNLSNNTNSSKEINNIHDYDDLPISPVLSIYNNSDHYTQKQDFSDECHQNNIQTPSITPANSNDLEYQIQRQLNLQPTDNEIYSEAEDYMVMGYYHNNYDNTNGSLSKSSSSSNIIMHNNNAYQNNQCLNSNYNLYDLKNEEIEMINSQHCIQNQQMEYQSN